MTETHPENRLVSYAHVSTCWQTVDAKPEQLRAAGCSSRNTYREKVPGAWPDRRDFLRMLDRLALGDVVTPYLAHRGLDPRRDMHRLDGGDRRHADPHALSQEFLRGAVVGPARVRGADV